jgi:hypothetical protein
MRAQHVARLPRDSYFEYRVGRNGFVQDASGVFGVAWINEELYERQRWVQATSVVGTDRAFDASTAELGRCQIGVVQFEKRLHHHSLFEVHRRAYLLIDSKARLAFALSE